MERHTTQPAPCPQVYAYLKNLEAHGIRRAEMAVLLYASNGESFDLRYRMGPHEIQARTLNLDQPWQGIRSDLVRFAKELQHAQPADAAC